MKTTIAIATAALGTSVVGWAGLSEPVSAASLSFVSQGDATPAGWTNLNWTVEGRAGVAGAGDWEFGIKDGTASNTAAQLNWTWNNSQEVAWSLDWDGTTALFSIGNQSIALAQPNPPSDIFNGFYLWTRATTADGQVDPGTNISLQVNAVNGESVTPASSSATAPTSGTEITKNYFSSDTFISSLSGIASMSWLDDAVNPQQERARSRVSLRIEGFDTGERPTDDSTTESVPEPTAIAGLLVLGALGAASGLKGK
jgi:hypothetical protein